MADGVVNLDALGAVRYTSFMSDNAASGPASGSGSSGLGGQPLRCILVSTDFSPASDHALDYALRLAQKLSASVILCHCAPQPDYEVAGLVSPGMRTAAAAFIEKAMEMAIAARVELAELAARKRDFGVAISIEMLEGRPADAIILAARRSGADLIVIGSRSRPGIRHLLLGSVAEKVVRAAPCPVLVVHPDDQQAESPAQ